ncbi:hypothetical protein [Croceivirga radicis]|uniref:hypothetical protein n=1 Tax=Croceivirga radicis TaxID=1929488 RepID=UPI000255AB95|nr:hypothetical protein [Croceivirga radicis]
MKWFSYIFFSLIFSLSSCSSQKTFVKEAPFTTGDVTCQYWAGGRAESGSGTKLKIPVGQLDKEGVAFAQAFFRGKVADLKMVKNSDEMYAEANFSNKMDKPDIVMHADPKKEVGNKPPKLQKENPFELSENECVISYTENGELKYLKIDNVKELKPKMYQ